MSDLWKTARVLGKTLSKNLNNTISSLLNDTTHKYDNYNSVAWEELDAYLNDTTIEPSQESHAYTGSDTTHAKQSPQELLENDFANFTVGLYN